MSRFQIPAPELARLTHNALAFMPARSAVKVCRFELSLSEFLTATATDLYVVGCDISVVEVAGWQESECVDLSRDDVVTLDKIARAKKKEAVEMDIVHHDGLSVLDDNGTWMPMRDASDQRPFPDLWDKCDELLRRETPQHLLLIDPKLMAAFGKVKCAGETVADLSIADGDAQISVRIGSTFRGAIMPVDRDKASMSEDLGPDGLWPST
jgi:hypothetical protein